MAKIANQTQNAIAGPHGSSKAKKLAPEERGKPAAEGIKQSPTQLARNPATRKRLSKALQWHG